MQRRLSKKLSLLRPVDGLLPLSLFIAALAGAGEALTLYKYALAAAMLALGTAAGLRRAFSAQPSMRMVRGSVVVALALQPIGGALTAGAIYLKNGGMSPHTPWFAVAAALLNVEHVFYEYLYAAGSHREAALTRAATSSAVLAALLSHDLKYIAAATGAGALISAAVGLARGGPLKGKPNVQVLRSAPAALLQLALYPAAWAALRRVPQLPLHSATAAPLFAGLILWTLSRSPFRRSALEARPFNRAMLVVLLSSALALALSQSPPVAALTPFPLAATALSLLLAALCSLAVYGNLERTEG